MKEQKSFSAVDISDRVSKVSVYLLVFLLPILFLPWTANVLDFNKQALLIVLALVAIFAWMLKVLILGKIELNLSMVHIPVLTLLLAYIASGIFSSWGSGSFWGWPQITSESTLSVLGLTLLYFLIVNIFKRKEVFYLAVTLVVSGSIAMLYGLLQVLGKFILPIEFTKVASFNTIGGVNALAIFAAILLPLIITFLTISKEKKLRIFFIVSVIVAAILLLMINFNVAWWIVIAGSALVIAFGTQRRDIFDNRWIILPMIFLAMALLFSFFNFQIPGAVERPNEVYLTQRASFDISWKSLQNSPIVGSGPGTFIYNFAKAKDISFNESTLWNLKFDWAGSRMLTIMGTMGILGVLGFLALIGFFTFYGIKFLFTRANGKKEGDEDLGQDFYLTLGMGIFISFLTASVAYFLYASGLSIDFVYFVLMACFVSILYPIKKEIVLKPSSLLTLGVTFSFTIIFILGLGVLILEGQRYVSAVSYLDSIKAMQEGRGMESINKLETAIRISPKVDLYWREISQVYVQAMNSVGSDPNLSQADAMQKVQLYINSAVNAAKTATEVNPTNVANWSVRGYIYQNLIGVVGGTKDWSVSAYDEALKLEPINPFFPTQAGMSILAEVRSLPEERKSEKPKLLSDAEAKFNQAIELKSDYASAHFQLALTHQLKGDQEQMTVELETAKSIAPFDVGLAFQLGMIYYQLADFGKAQAELERAVLLSPDYANALYFLGLTYDKQGEKEKAIQVFEVLKVSNPENDVVTVVLQNLKSGKKALAGIDGNTKDVPIEEDIQEEPKE